jgi:hypothetical protein
MFVSNHDAVILAIWWLANYFPFGGPGYVMRLTPVQLVAKVLLQITRASTMCKVMSITSELHPTATIAVIIMGALLPAIIEFVGNTVVSSIFLHPRTCPSAVGSILL